MIGKKLINTGGAAVDTNLPSGYFNTVLYEGNGGTQRIGGYINRGALFNGSSSYITLPTGSPFNDSNTIKSVSAWVKLNSTSDRVYPFSVSSTTVANDFFNFGYLGDSNNILLSIRDGSSSNQVSHSVSVTIDTNWHHIVAQTTGNSVEIYLDGVSQTITSTYSGTGSSGSWISYPSYGGSVVGNIGINRKLSSVFSNGKIDQVRIFNKALSSSEVTTLYGETHASTTISTTDIFDDNSGVALYQLDGNANDTGGASGKFGSAAIFNGSSSKIFLTSTGTSITDYDSDFSISMWVYMVNLPHANSQDHLWTGGGTRIIPMTINTDGTVFIDFFNVSSNSLTSNTALTQNGWTHLVMTRSKTNGLKFYLDGSESGTSSYTGNAASLSQKDSIGSYWDGTRMSFDGKIDQVRIYSSALSSSDVTNLYNESSVPTTNLVAHYKLDGDARDEQQLYDGTATNVTYAYDGTATNVTYQEATNFSPDLVWIKQRNATQSNQLADSVRGANKHIFSDLTTQEVTYTGRISSFDSNGFTLGSEAQVNGNNQTFAAWCFNAGTDAAASNTDGSITSTVKANQDAGFSIVKYTAGGTATVGHGLSQAPELIITKNLDASEQWFVYAEPVGTQKFLGLNTTSAATSNSGVYTSVGSSTFTNNISSTSRTYINYCFHSVDGFQKVDSYTGTGASGNMVETGFEPAWILIKNTTSGSSSSWWMLDNKRNTTNPRNTRLIADGSFSENTSGNGNVNFYSDGFELLGSYHGTNANNNTYIYLAIAADPDTTTPTVENSFDVVTYTGNGGTQSIDVDFKPDLVWIKNRDIVVDHALIDSVRGAAEVLRSNQTTAETTRSDSLTSFDSNGFTLGSDGVWWTNKSGDDYVAWCWKAGDHDDNLPQINTEGTIDSVVSVNDAAGFSIVKYTGNGTAGATIGHGLSQKPELFFIKNIEANYNWIAWCNEENTELGYLDVTDSFASSRYSWALNSTQPTSTLITLGNDASVNTSYNYIAYCFASISGYQKVGSYTGTGSAGNSVTTGFQPRFLMIKNITNTGSTGWIMLDTSRDGTTENGNALFANSNASEWGASNTTVDIDFTATGFTIQNGYVVVNGGSDTYIYLAIA